MQTIIFRYRSKIQAPAQLVFDWHTREGAIHRLTPPWMGLRVSGSGGIREGQKVLMKIKIPFLPFRRKWIAEHTDFKFGREFTDIQRKGPFSFWKHIHRITPDPDDESVCTMEDEVQYRLPLASLSHKMLKNWMDEQLRRSFAYRHRVLAHDMALIQGYPLKRKRILVSGTRGLLGSALVPFLQTAGHDVVRLVRHPSQRNNEIYINPDSGFINEFQLEGVDAVIHLSGENIGRRWTSKRKKRILESRQVMTQQLAEALAGLKRKPDVLITASGTGIYRESFVKAHTEDGPPDATFLADVVKVWEQSAKPTRDAGIRVIHARFGIILSMRGGALKKMLPAFRVGFGGKIGRGNQYMSWIALDDAVAALYHLLYQNVVTGPINVVAPKAEPNRSFTRQLGKALARPAVFSIPEPVIRFLFGEMGEETLLKSIHAKPQRLLNQSFSFQYPTLLKALRHLLGAKGSY